MNDYLETRELYHHGVKGQKWGERRYQNEDGTLTSEGRERYGDSATNYTREQYTRDARVYGKIAAKRMNEKALNGESVSGFRSDEARRIDKFRKGAVVARNIGSIAGTAAGTIGGIYASKKVKKYMGSMANDPVASLAISTAVTAGSVYLGKTIGRYGGQSIAMLSGGYAPSKFRY